MDEYRVDTPENIAFSYQVSGIGSRFLAALIDTAIIGILMIVALLTAAAFLSTSVGHDLIGGVAQSWIIAGYSLLAVIIYWAYYIFFELIWNGQSPGKRLIGLRVIRTDGTPVTAVDSAVRNLVRLVDFMPAYYGVGVIVMLVNSQARRLGDLAAGTVVIKERREVTLPNLASSASRTVAPTSADSPPMPVEAVLWPLERLTDDDYYVVNEFFARQDKLPNRDVLACRLASAMRAKLELPLTQPLTTAEAVDFLGQISAVYRWQGSSGSDRMKDYARPGPASEVGGQSPPDSFHVMLTCPRCGATVTARDTVCPTCGETFTGG
jgi:uncharacterized RDD family membrane protein YckC